MPGTAHIAKGDAAPMMSQARRILDCSVRLICSAPVQLVLVVVWVVYMRGRTDSCFVDIILVGLVAAACIVVGRRLSPLKRDRFIARIGASLMTVATILANYSFLRFDILHLLPFVGCWIAFYQDLLLLYCVFGKAGTNRRELRAAYPWKRFAASVACIWGAYLVYLLLSSTPGHLTWDSLVQLDQVLTGTYTNHHPFWHTMLVAACVEVGRAFSGTINTGILVYSIVQGLLMALAFSHCAVTLKQFGLRRWWVVAACFVLLPYHVVYSATMWKDVLFGCAVLLLCTQLARMLLLSSPSRADWVLLTLASLLAIIMRNNGVFVVAAMCVVVIVCSLRRLMPRGLIVPLLIGLVVGMILTGPVLRVIDVAPTSIHESLSIPLQQMARVVHDGEPIDDQDASTLSSFVDTKAMSDAYTPWLSDPVKSIVDDEWIEGHKLEFLSLWARLGVAHPVAYAKSWIDQTRGYWYGGYKRGAWERGEFVDEAKLRRAGAIRSEHIGASYEAGVFPEPIDRALDWFATSPVAQPLRSIGMATWLLLAVLLYAVDRRNVALVLCCLPPLAVIATLLIATPVYSEFRYAYSLFTCIPFVVGLAMLGTAKVGDGVRPEPGEAPQTPQSE